MTRLKDGHIGKRYKQNEFDHYEIGMERLILQDLLSKNTCNFTEDIAYNYVDIINEF